MTKFHCYNIKKKKDYVFKDNSFFAVKFQKHLNKNMDNIIYSASESGLKLLKISYAIKDINIC